MNTEKLYMLIHSDSVEGILHEGSAVFPNAWGDIALNAEDALRKEVDICISLREKGIITSFEVSNYDPSSPEKGWVVETYKDGEPYQKTVCQEVIICKNVEVKR
jgi:hypothetical protein